MFEFSSPPTDTITDMEQHGESLLALFTNLVELPFYEHYKFSNGIEVSVTRVAGDAGFMLDTFGFVLGTDLSPEDVIARMHGAAH